MSLKMTDLLQISSGLIYANDKKIFEKKLFFQLKKKQKLLLTFSLENFLLLKSGLIKLYTLSTKNYIVIKLDRLYKNSITKRLLTILKYSHMW